MWLEINEALNREDVPDLTKEAMHSALKTEDRQLVPKYTRTREKDIYFTYYG